MATHGGKVLDLSKISDLTVDQNIAAMASQPMKDVVTLVEGKNPRIGFPYGESNAAKFLVGRLFTDAVFNQDIRAIQLIINRIDGGLPKDVDMDNYQTYFGDCLNEVMSTTDGTQLKVMPDDTVMMALCKSLYATSVEDIYWDEKNQRKRRPTDAQKRDRDTALRMVLERAGGRKTTPEIAKEKETTDIADWIKSLPST